MRGGEPASPVSPRSRPLFLGALLAALLAAPRLAPGAEPVRRVEVSEEFAVLLSAGAISVEMRPLDGESPIEFARRVARDDATADRILALPGGLSRARRTQIGFGALSDELKRAAMKALFPADVRTPTGWLHIALADESLAWIAEWLAGSASAGSAIARANGLAEGVVSRGTSVRVPAEMLDAAFREAESSGEESPPILEYGSDEKGRYALYRLRPKEALYSSVVVRFTGRLFADDVVLLALKIAERSGIEDVHGIPVGFPVKIPVEMLSPEFLPPGDPKAEAAAKAAVEASQFAAPPAAGGANLAGTRIVIDAGHGGRDTGTLQGGIWEATYVYDVAVRLRKVLMERTAADVVMLVKERDIGFTVPETDRLPNRKGRILQTEPPHPLDDPVVGVNLRWYLANSLLRKPGPAKKRIPPEKTVFLSIHADSLHPSVRGAMMYVPGERFLRDRYGKKGAVYADYREFREQPVVAFNKKERVSAEGVSTLLAQKLLGAIRAAELPVHPFSPVRTHVIRGGREWVPAVLRYNQIPNRVLVEISNLSNHEDRDLTLTRRFRQQMAEALAAGLASFFTGTRPEARIEKAELPAPAAVRPEGRPVQGPWPRPNGPLPDIQGPWRPYGPLPRATSRRG